MSRSAIGSRLLLGLALASSAPYMVSLASLAFLRAHKPEVDALGLGEMMQGSTSSTPDSAAHNPQQP